MPLDRYWYQKLTNEQRSKMGTGGNEADWMRNKSDRNLTNGQLMEKVRETIKFEKLLRETSRDRTDEQMQNDWANLQTTKLVSKPNYHELQYQTIQSIHQDQTQPDIID